MNVLQHQESIRELVQFYGLSLDIEAFPGPNLLLLSNRSDQVPPMQHEVSVLVLELVILLLLLHCCNIQKFALFHQGLLSQRLFCQEVPNSRRVVIYEAIFLCSAASVQLTPLLTNQELFKVSLIYIGIFLLPPGIVLNLMVGKQHGQVDNAANDRVQRHIDLFILEPVFADQRHSDGAFRVFNGFVTILACWLPIFVANREVHVQLNWLTCDSWS